MAQAAPSHLPGLYDLISGDGFPGVGQSELGRGASLRSAG